MKRKKIMIFSKKKNPIFLKKSIIAFLILFLLLQSNIVIFTTNGNYIRKSINQIGFDREKAEDEFHNYFDVDFVKPNVHEIGPDQYMNPAADADKSYAYNYGYWVGRHLANNYTMQGIGFRNTLGMHSYKDVDRALENLSIFKNLKNPEINSYESQYISFFTDLLTGLRNALIKYEGDNKPSIPGRNLFNNQCTTTITTNKATKGDYTYQSQNFDLTHKLSGFYFHFLKEFTHDAHGTSVSGSKFTYNVYIIDIPSHNNINLNKYALWGIPVLYEIPFINEKGIGHSGNAIVNETIFGSQMYGAWIQFLNIWTMLNCNDTKDVDKIYSNIRKCYTNYDDEREKLWPYKYDSSTTMWSDNKGGILSIEYAGEYIYDPINKRYQHEWFRNVTDATIGQNNEFEGVNEDILWHGNDMQWVKENEDYDFTRRITAQCRATRAMNILNDSYGEIDFYTIYNLCRDRYYSESPIYKINPLCNICCGTRMYYKMLGTYFAWIIETEHNQLPIVRWSPGSLAGQSPYLYDLSTWQEFRCSDYFD